MNHQKQTMNIEEEHYLSLETDLVTGVSSRNAFRMECQQILQENPDEVYDFAVADIKNFRLINNIYGQSKADELLHALGSYLKAHNDFLAVGRLGGDQLACLIRSESDLDEAWAKSIADGFQTVSPIPHVCIKFGIYNRVDHSLSIPMIFDRALFALKSIKNNFSVTSTRFDGEISRKLYQRQIFEARFSTALQNKEFAVWYQPKYDPYTKKIVGAEALVRWFIDGNMVPPGVFLPVLEEDGLIAQLDAYVFEQVCIHHQKWMEQGIPLIPISVNLSRASMIEGDAVHKYGEIAKHYDVDVKYLPLEITESTAVESKELRQIVHRLRLEGFSLHMDDFGSGHSSLYSLNSLDFDVLKLDKGLIDYIGNETGNTILHHTIVMANDLNLKVVAEGVENEQQLDFLEDMGCDSIQGYYFSKPLPETQFDQLYFETNLLKENASREKRKKETLVEQLKKQTQIINSLNGIYLAIYYINLTDCTFRMVFSNDRMNILLGEAGDAHKALTETVEKLVCPESRPDLYSFLDFRTLPQRLAGKKVLAKNFNGIHIGSACALIIPVERDSAGNVCDVIYAIRPLDEKEEY